MSGLKRILIGPIATAAVIAVLPGAASAADASYFVAKFDGKSKAKLAFKATSDQVSDIAFKTRVPCSKGSGTLTAGLDPAQLADGRFSSAAKPPVLQKGNVFRVRGSGVPGSPVGKLRIRVKTLKGKTCGKTMKWSASEVSEARWNRYRQRNGFLS